MEHIAHICYKCSSLKRSNEYEIGKSIQYRYHKYKNKFSN